MHKCRNMCTCQGAYAEVLDQVHKCRNICNFLLKFLYADLARDLQEQFIIIIIITIMMAIDEHHVLEPSGN